MRRPEAAAKSLTQAGCGIKRPVTASVGPLAGTRCGGHTLILERGTSLSQPVDGLFAKANRFVTQVKQSSGLVRDYHARHDFKSNGHSASASTAQMASSLSGDGAAARH